MSERKDGKRKRDADDANMPIKKKRRLRKKGEIPRSTRRKNARKLARAQINEAAGGLDPWDIESDESFSESDEFSFIVYSDNEEELVREETQRALDMQVSRGHRGKKARPKEPEPSNDDSASDDDTFKILQKRLRARVGHALPDSATTDAANDDIFAEFMQEIENFSDPDSSSSESKGDDYAGQRKRRLRKHRKKKLKEKIERTARELDIPLWERDGFGADPKVQSLRKFGKVQDWQRMMQARDAERSRARINAPIPDSEMRVPFLGLRTDLKHHQIVALTYCLLREHIPYRGVRGGIIGDDMGSGKTLLTYALIAFDKICGYKRKPNMDNIIYAPPTLIVCPASLIESWRTEWAKHFASHRMRVIFLTATGGGPRAEIDKKDLLSADAIVVSYETARSMYGDLLRELKFEMQKDASDGVKRFGKWIDDREMTAQDRTKQIATCAEDLRPGFEVLWNDETQWRLGHFIFGYPFCRAVFDESTKCSNSSSQIFKSTIAIRAERRWLLSGTPIQNHISDLYSQLRLLGVDRHVKALRNKRCWNSFLRSGDTSLDADRRVTGGATTEAIDALKRKVLNIMLMRREIHNIALVDPIWPYLERARCASNDWDEWREWRGSDSYSNKHDSVRKFYEERDRDIDDEAEARDMGADLSTYQLALLSAPDAGLMDVGESSDDDGEEEEEVVIEELIAEATRESMSKDVGWTSLHQRKRSCAPPMVLAGPAGFYWDTKQSVFMHGVKHVNIWMRKALGIGISDVATSLQLMRDKMRSIGHSTFPDNESDRKEIFGAATLKWRDGTPVEVWCGKRKIKPILLLGDMHRYERAVYLFITQRASEMMRASDEKNKHGCAFVTSTFARLTTTDYRFPAGAAQMLHSSRGTLVPMEEPTRTFSLNPSHARQEKEDMRIALLQEDNVQLQEGDRGKLGAAHEEEVDAVTNTISKQMTRYLDPVGNSKKSNIGDATVTKVPESYFVPSKPPTKAVMTARYVLAAPKDDKIIVFIDMTKPIAWLREYLESFDIVVAVMTGDMSTSTRRKELECFHRVNSFIKNGKGTRRDDTGEVQVVGAQVFLLSLKLAYMGQNLQIANHVLFYSIWWNPTVDEQGKSRIDRMGQRKEMKFVYLAIRGTIDEIVLTRAAGKAGLGGEVIGGHDGLIATTTSSLRPDENSGIFVDTAQPVLKRGKETMKDFLSQPVVEFKRTEEELEKMRKFRSENGRLNRVQFVNFIIEDAKRFVVDVDQ